MIVHCSMVTMVHGILYHACVFEVNSTKKTGLCSCKFYANDAPKDVAGLSPFHDGMIGNAFIIM